MYSNLFLLKKSLIYKGKGVEGVEGVGISTIAGVPISTPVNIQVWKVWKYE